MKNDTKHISQPNIHHYVSQEWHNDDNMNGQMGSPISTQIVNIQTTSYYIIMILRNYFYCSHTLLYKISYSKPL